ncbi:hypothetical protein G6M89_08090 [Natronolimnobius sp. AArcel1]|uniref:hypothetical protein n=1 Tax=Natronolimnobius sp. AArcel1 TaxID=1679093 RepID=UPI0013EDE048|nr:hypothetical protein [Natronolimnobius sp. AArcel1]NGM68972.1 hypothetical protein [Natronolimnobius sp. AArcel1]
MVGSVIDSLRASSAGIALALVLATVAPPALSIGAGAVAVVMIVRRIDGYRPYAWSGTIFVLGLAVSIWFVSTNAITYDRTAFVSLLGFGFLSLIVLGVRAVVRGTMDRTLRHVTDETASAHSSHAGATVFGTLLVGKGVLLTKERIARSGTVGIVAPVAAVLDAAGITFEAPGLWLIDGSLNVVTLTFIGAIVVGFHTLSSWHAVFRLRQTDAARSAADRSRRVAATTTRNAGRHSRRAARATKTTSMSTLEQSRATLAAIVEQYRSDETSFSDRSASTDVDACADNRGANRPEE